MHRAEIESLYMREGAFQEVILRGAKIDGQLDMTGSTFAAALDMGRAEIGTLYMRDGKFWDVYLHGAKIGDQLDMSSSTFADALDMHSVTVGGDLFLRGADLAALDCRDATVAGTMDLSMSRVENGLRMADIHIMRSLDLRGATLRQPTSMQFAQVERSVLLAGAHLSTLNLTSARIGRDLVLGSPEPVWTPDASLGLRDVHVRRLLDSTEAWPSRLQLDGLTYQILRGSDPETDAAERSVEWFKQWLQRQSEYSQQPYEQLAQILRASGQPEKADAILFHAVDRLKQVSHRSPQPYFTLAKALRAAGHPARADSVLYESRVQLRSADVWQWIQWAFIGYGYRVWHALIWIAALIITGWFVVQKADIFLPGGRERLGFWYSVDRLLPIVELRKLHYDVDLPPRSRVYFYFHTVMGYVLATFLLAGLSGLVG